MLRAMETNTRDHRAPTPPSRKPQDEKPSGRWPGSRTRNSRFENPSLERYTDLRFEDRPKGHRRWVVVLASVLLAIVLGVLGLMAAIYFQARNDEARNVDAIVVMGAAQYNGRPSEVLSARLDHALDLYNRGYASVIIVTGGNLPGDIYTEAEVSEQYLLDRGVPQQAILMENEGNDTWHSMQGVAEVAEGRDINDVLIVSDGFHLFRSERMANKVGFDTYSSAAPDSPIRPWSGNEFSYVIRETGAVIVQIPEWLF
jgi:vancomycin permeability regulator SanA